MLLAILIIFLLINALPALYFGKKYFNMKKNKASDNDFEKLSESMMKSEKIIIPVSIILVLVLYFIQ